MLQIIRYVQWFFKNAPVTYKSSYAAYSKMIMRRTVQNGLRYHPPNWLEYQVSIVVSRDRRTEILKRSNLSSPHRRKSENLHCQSLQDRMFWLCKRD